VLKRSAKKKSRIEDSSFLKALGRHCEKLRMQKGYSIDRLSRESDHLSTSVIHRLEKASGAVTVSALYRYGKVLKTHPKHLLDFPLPSVPSESALRVPPRIINEDDPRVKREAFRTMLPLYSLKAAAGYFGNGESVHPEGWVEINGFVGKLDREMFVARAVGESMLPRIKNDDLLVFRADPGGTRQGKILLVQYRGPADPETGGSYTVKEYHSSKAISSDGSWQHTQITLKSLNPEYETILLSPIQEGDFRVIAEYLFTVSGV
jgi:SOS-response transcriptional repressor LexA